MVCICGNNLINLTGPKSAELRIPPENHYLVACGRCGHLGAIYQEGKDWRFRDLRRKDVKWLEENHRAKLDHWLVHREELLKHLYG
jgi:hypothetical protein